MLYFMLMFFILSIISGILAFAGFTDITLRHIGETSVGTFVIVFFITCIVYFFQNINRK